MISSERTKGKVKISHFLSYSSAQWEVIPYILACNTLNAYSKGQYYNTTKAPTTRRQYYNQYSQGPSIPELRLGYLHNRKWQN